jgi:hypothetical protein
LEAARDLVRLAHFPALVEFYWQQTDWYCKAGVVDLLQDTIVPITQPVMRDFLRAPTDTQGDWLDIAKIIALCHLDGDLGRFEMYLGDPALTAERVRTYLGTALVPAPVAAPAPLRVSRGGWVTVGLMLVLTLMFAGLGWGAMWERNRFEQEGVRVMAGVVHMEEYQWAKAQERYRVVYLFNAGDFNFVTDSDYVTADVWATAEATDKIEIVFLPSNPETNVPADEIDRPTGVLYTLAFGLPVLFALLLAGQATAEYLALTNRIRWKPKKYSFWEKR